MSATPPARSALRWLVPLAVFALVWLVFQPALRAEFLHFDDDQVITGNRAFRGLRAEHLSWMFRTSHLGHYQPASWLSFAVDYELFGLDAAAFHRTNVLLHALCAVAFYAFARLLFGRALPGRASGSLSAILAAGAAAALFALHPLRAESVAWVTERRDVLSGLFLMLGLGAWLRWAPTGPLAEGANPAPRSSRLAALGSALAAVGVFFASVELERGHVFELSGLGAIGLVIANGCLAVCAANACRAAPTAAPGDSRTGGRWYWLALACVVVSLFAKAWGIVLPAVLLVLDVWPLRRLRGPRDGWPLVAEKLPFVSLSIAFAALAAWAQATQIDTMKGLGDHTLVERIAQGAYGLAWYPWKTLVPTGLVAIYELPEVLSLSDPRFLVPLLAVVAVTLALWLMRRRAPGLLAAWVVFAIVVSPVLGVAQSGPQLVADRYSYLSCMPFALLAGAALLVARPTVVVGGVLAAVIVVVGVLGRQQAAVWRDSGTLWEHALAERPDTPMAMILLASHYQRRAAGETDGASLRLDLDRARELLERAAELTDDAHVPSGLANVHGVLAGLEPARAGEHRARATTYAREALDRAHATGTFTPHYRLGYGSALWNAGRLDEALGHIEWFARMVPEDPTGLALYGRALAALGREAEARGPLERALTLAPRDVEAWRALIGVYETLGNAAGAAEARRRVAELGG